MTTSPSGRAPTFAFLPARCSLFLCPSICQSNSGLGGGADGHPFRASLARLVGSGLKAGFFLRAVACSPRSAQELSKVTFGTPWIVPVVGAARCVVVACVTAARILWGVA